MPEVCSNCGETDQSLFSWELCHHWFGSQFGSVPALVLCCEVCSEILATATDCDDLNITFKEAK